MRPGDPRNVLEVPSPRNLDQEIETVDQAGDQQGLHLLIGALGILALSGCGSAPGGLPGAYGRERQYSPWLNYDGGAANQVAVVQADGTVAHKSLELGAETGDAVEVQSGLAEGDEGLALEIDSSGGGVLDDIGLVDRRCIEAASEPASANITSRSGTSSSSSK